MHARAVTLPELILIAGTRVAFGAGVGLLVGHCLTPQARRAVGWTLVIVGAATTVPLVADLLCRPGIEPSA